MAEVGFPPGVVNIVPGPGRDRRRAPRPSTRASRKIAFTGSTAVGRRIVQASAGNLKRVQLELGGKGANIVFADADLDAAVNGSAFAIFHNQGQACIAGSRLILHETIADEFLDRFIALAASIRLGDPLDPATEMGPLTSAGHRDRVLALRRRSRASEGGEVLTGGTRAGRPGAGRRAATSGRRSSAPTARSRVCQEEVFGPFVTVTTFRSDEEAIAIANGVEYGLGGGLWTRDLSAPTGSRAAIRAGMVWINCLQARQPGLAVRRRRPVGLRPRDGLRGDARVHRGQVGLGQRRRRHPAVVPAALRMPIAMEPSPTTRCPAGSSSAVGAFDRVPDELDRLGRAAAAAHRRPLRPDLVAERLAGAARRAGRRRRSARSAPHVPIEARRGGPRAGPRRSARRWRS